MINLGPNTIETASDIPNTIDTITITITIDTIDTRETASEIPKDFIETYHNKPCKWISQNPNITIGISEKYPNKVSE
jgi:hypothetical protein